MEDAPHDQRQAGLWLRRLSGLGFLLLGLICALSAVISAAAVSLASKPWAEMVLTAVSVWLGATCLLFAYRLLRNRPRPDGGLMSPAALRLAAVFFIGLPLASVATGAWKNNYPSFLVLMPQALAYFSIGASFWLLARARDRHNASTTGP